VAIKVASPDIAHKSDVGGVELNLPDAKAAAAAAERVVKRASAAWPDARIEGVVAATMQRGLGEAIVGFRRDPQVGPIVLVGAGGTLAELYGDVALHPAPVTLAQARRMVGEVRAFAALAGYRNAPRGDLEALARAVAAFSRLAALPEIAEAEINPLVVRAEGEGAVGVDALLVLREGAPFDDAAA
jgi:acetate---CoA ligase (ADP-forming)